MFESLEELRGAVLADGYVNDSVVVLDSIVVEHDDERTDEDPWHGEYVNVALVLE
jgi:hypothetical protein